MEITEVRIKLMEDSGERLQAFCSLTFDDAFVVRDLKIIEGSNGPFVAMPSRKLTAHCGNCQCKNHLRAAFCNQCGAKLNPDDRVIKDAEGRAKLYADIAHPINSVCREMIQDRVIREFHLEQERAKQPGYVSQYDEFEREDMVVRAIQSSRPPRAAAKPNGRTHPQGPHHPPVVREAQPEPPVHQQQPASTPHSSGGGVARNSPDNFGAGIF